MFTFPNDEVPGSDKVPDVLEDEGVNMLYLKIGYFGKVSHSVFYEFKQIETGRHCVIKAMPRILTEKSSLSEAMKLQNNFLVEKGIHELLRHENVARLLTVFQDYNNQYLVTEPCLLGSLKQLLVKRHKLDLIKAKLYLGQLSMACNYLHSNLIVHRDLQTRNLYLDQNNKIKVANFSCAYKFQNREDVTTSICDSTGYLSPEMLEETGHSFKVDIWAIGCVFYEMLVGKTPFFSDDPEEVHAMIRSGKYRNFPEDMVISPKVKKFLKSTLRVDPSKRPSIEQLLGSSFLNDEVIPHELPVTLITHEEEKRKNMASIEPVATPESIEIQPVSGAVKFNALEETIQPIQTSPKELEITTSSGLCLSFCAYSTCCSSRE